MEAHNTKEKAIMKTVLIIAMFGLALCTSDTGGYIEPKTPQRKLVMMMLDGGDAQYTRVAHLPSTAKVYYKFEEERLIEVKIEYNDDQPSHAHHNLDSVLGNAFKVENDDMDKEEYILDTDFDLDHNPTLLYNVDNIKNTKELTEIDSSENFFKGELNPSSIISRYNLDINSDEDMPLHTKAVNIDTSFTPLPTDEPDFENHDVDIEPLYIDSDFHHTTSPGIHISTSIDSDFEVPLPILRSKSATSRNIVIEDIDTHNNPEPHFEIRKSFDDEYDYTLVEESNTPLLQPSQTFASSGNMFIKEVDISYDSEPYIEVSSSTHDDFVSTLDNEPSITYARHSIIKDMDTSEQPEPYIKMTKSLDDEFNYQKEDEYSTAEVQPSGPFSIKREHEKNSEEEDDDMTPNEPQAYFKIKTSIDDEFNHPTDTEYNTAMLKSTGLLTMEREQVDFSDDDNDDDDDSGPYYKVTTSIDDEHIYPRNNEFSSIEMQSSSFFTMEKELDEEAEDDDVNESNEPHTNFKISTSMDDEFNFPIDNEYITTEIQSTEIFTTEREQNEETDNHLPRIG